MIVVMNSAANLIFFLINPYYPIGRILSHAVLQIERIFILFFLVGLLH